MRTSRHVAAGKSTLGRLLGSEARARILTALLLGAPERYYVRSLATRLGIPPTAVSRELVTLEELGLVRRMAEGRRLYCELDREASVIPELRTLVLKLGGIAEALRGALEGHAGAILWAFLYGSMADGRGTVSSDIDLFVVGEVSSIELSDTLRPVAGLLGRDISPYVISPAEFVAKRRKSEHFVSRVLAGPRMDLIGNARSAQAAD
jgi:DNA-binding transcriptional ArsR family regulator